VVSRVEDSEAPLEIRKLISGILVIIVLGIVLGAAFNFPLLRRFAAGEFREGFIDRQEYEGIRFISLAETQDLFAQKMQGAERLLFIDSRGHDDFAAGHIPGALAVPLDSVQRSGKRQAGSEWAGTLDFPGAQTLIIYCEGGDCLTSISLAKILHDKGYKDIRIFSGGWAEWSAAGLPEER
jgi:rhodanese-related sulfurtransferase